MIEGYSNYVTLRGKLAATLFGMPCRKPGPGEFKSFLQAMLSVINYNMDGRWAVLLRDDLGEGEAKVRSIYRACKQAFPLIHESILYHLAVMAFAEFYYDALFPIGKSEERSKVFYSLADNSGINNMVDIDYLYGGANSDNTIRISLNNNFNAVGIFLTERKMRIIANYFYRHTHSDQNDYAAEELAALAGFAVTPAPSPFKRALLNFIKDEQKADRTSGDTVVRWNRYKLYDGEREGEELGDLDHLWALAGLPGLSSPFSQLYRLPTLAYAKAYLDGVKKDPLFPVPLAVYWLWEHKHVFYGKSSYPVKGVARDIIRWISAEIKSTKGKKK